MPFNYKGTSVRTIQVGADPFFVLPDICKVLGLTNPSKVANQIDPDALTTSEVIDSMGRNQRVNVVNEAGLYEVIFMSRKAEAKAFKRWVTHEVLPSIRKRGGYLTPEATEKALTDPDFIIQLATSLKEERAKRAALEAENEANKPKVLFADAVTTSHTSILVGDLAKLVQQNGIPLGANRLFKWLRKHGYLISRKGTDWNMPTQKAQELGLFRVKETAVTHPDGHVTVNRTPKVTGKGQEYFISRFLDGRFDIASDIESR